MRTLVIRIRCWIEDKISWWFFGNNYATALVLMNAGRIYTDRLEEQIVVCSHCGSKWFPLIEGRSPDGSHAAYCPFCGYHR